jgi:anhydro-N-acetylmuramic acid kinase
MQTPASALKAKTNLYIGTMSGTSADGLDIVLCNIRSIDKVELLASSFAQYPDDIREKIFELQLLNEESIKDQSRALNLLDMELAEFYAKHINKLLKSEQIKANEIISIGNHGQTILHKPNLKKPFSLQICHPQKLSEMTGISVIADFRTADIKASGQGAPLIPAFHQQLFSHFSPCAIVNIGGIANTTYLTKTEAGVKTLGHDNGPGNSLLDQWIHKHLSKKFDRNGDWAKSGKINSTLLEKLLSDEYFQQATPKSTGQDYFNLSWLESYSSDVTIDPKDVQATLCELTVETIAKDFLEFSEKTNAKSLYVCGGGVHNKYLMQRLERAVNKNTGKHNITIQSTQTVGIDPDWVEAMGFAWLAYCFENKIVGNLPSVTGAKSKVVLGEKFIP